jgi:hypothetical protein
MNYKYLIGGSIMSDLSTASCLNGNRCDNGISPIFLILALLFLGGNDNGMLGGILGGFGGKNDCGCNNGLDGILPILLLLLVFGGSL